MRPKEINIIRYGPVRDIHLKLQSGLNVIYGANESGKTLTIDAIIKMLLSDSVKDFEEIERVEEQPEGFIIMEKEGEEIKFSRSEGTLSEYLNVDSNDLRNIFVIRNSDLSILSQGEYFRSFTNRIVGIQTDRIKLIMESLQGAGWLTRPDSTATLSSSKANNEIARRRKNAQKLLEKARDYVKIIEKEGLDKIEYDTIELKNDLLDLEESIKTMEKARDKQRYLIASSALEEVKANIKELDALSPFEETTLDGLNEMQKESVRLEVEIQDLKKNYEDEKISLKQSQDELEQIEAELKPLDDRVGEVTDLKSRISLHQDKMKLEANNIKTASTYWKFFVFSLGFSVVSFIASGLLSSFQATSLIFPIGLLFFAIISGGLYWRANRTANILEAEKEELLSKAAKSGIEAKDLNKVLRSTASLEDRQNELKGRVEKKRTDVNRLEGSTNKLIEAIEKKGNRVTELESSITLILQKNGIDSVEDFRSKVDLKKQLSTRVKELMGELRGNLGQTNKGEEEDLEYWENEVLRLKPFGDLEVIVSFDERAYEEMRSKSEELEPKLREFETKLEDHRNTLREFHDRAMEIRPLNREGEETYVEVVTTSDLKELERVLSDFIEYIDRRFNTTIEALRIFEKVRSREETKVSTLFDDGRIGGLILKITDGRYIDVAYNSETQVIELKKRDGTKLEASKLSKGTIDQLYMSIRVSLAEKLLPDEPAFFILDDPFLTSDSSRLRKQMSVLKGLCDRGWSMTYFTVKDEVVRLAKEELKQPVIELASL